MQSWNYGEREGRSVSYGKIVVYVKYRVGDKSLARPGRKQATATKL